MPRRRRARSRPTRTPSGVRRSPTRLARAEGAGAVCAGARAYRVGAAVVAVGPTRLVRARSAPGRRPEDARPLLRGEALVALARRRSLLLLPYAAATRAAAVGGRPAAPRRCGLLRSRPLAAVGGQAAAGGDLPRPAGGDRGARARASAPASRCGRRSSSPRATAPGPLGEELTRALSLARRERSLGEREALVRVAREAGEPTFARFAELLAAKESPYLDFLRQQAAQARAEQNRYLERAADRAYLAMHAPVAPLLAVLVLLLAYGFLRFLAQTV